MDLEKTISIIEKIVNDHSGGIKFTELITELMIKFNEEKLDINEIEPDKIEKIIESMMSVKILEYTFKDLNRSKMFIYTP